MNKTRRPASPLLFVILSDYVDYVTKMVRDDVIGPNSIISD